jgi:hypothetical protein
VRQVVAPVKAESRIAAALSKLRRVLEDALPGLRHRAPASGQGSKIGLMEHFRRGFRKRFEKNDVLDGIEQPMARLVSFRREVLDVPTLIPALYQTGQLPRTPVKLVVLTQVAIRRALELAESMIRDANAFSYTPVWSSARSLFELASLIFDAIDRVTVLVETWDSRAFVEFNEHMDNVLLGWKSKDWHPGRNADELALTAKNIITIVQRIEKRHIPQYFSLYELMSEVVHPNYMGMIEAYQRVEGPDVLHVQFIDSPAEMDTERISIPLGNAVGSLKMLADAISEFESRLKQFTFLIAEKTGTIEGNGQSDCA